MDEHTSLVELIETLKNSLADVDIHTTLNQEELEAIKANIVEDVRYGHEKMLIDFLGQRAAKVADWHEYESPAGSVDNVMVHSAEGGTVYTTEARVGLLSPETVQTLIALLTMMHQQYGEQGVARQEQK